MIESYSRECTMVSILEQKWRYFSPLPRYSISQICTKFRTKWISFHFSLHHQNSGLARWKTWKLMWDEFIVFHQHRIVRYPVYVWNSWRYSILIFPIEFSLQSHQNPSRINMRFSFSIQNWSNKKVNQHRVNLPSSKNISWILNLPNLNELWHPPHPK